MRPVIPGSRTRMVRLIAAAGRRGEDALQEKYSQCVAEHGRWHRTRALRSAPGPLSPTHPDDLPLHSLRRACFICLRRREQVARGAS